ncbi:MAG: RIP metalloprotease RseP [Devosiaceae bacterium]|nr:RIP metalloprotease RseP [Devosiaceae bacterium]
MDFIIWLLSYIVPFLVVLTIIVFIHEMGHYLVARWNNIAIKTFSVGFGKELIGFTDKAGTRWKLSVIPLGGYVQFLGDMNAASVPDNEALEKFPKEIAPRLFANKNVWQRIAVVSAGPIANIIFTFLILYALLLGYGRYYAPATFDEIIPDTVAQSAGLQAGDEVLSIDGYQVRGFNDVQRLISTSPERPISIIVDRLGQELSFTITPKAEQITDRFGNNIKIGRIGVRRSIEPEEYKLYKPTMVEAVGMTFEEMWFIIDRTAAFIGDFFVGRGDLEQLGGPVKIAKVSGEVATLGIIALINLMALLSLNIGIFNLLPIPMLDGGHLSYYFYEAIRGKPLSQKIQDFGFRIGAFLIFSLMLFTIINDIF